MKISAARFLGSEKGKQRVTGVLVTETGEVYLGLHEHGIIGEIKQRRIRHYDDSRGFIEEGESILNYKILEHVDEEFVEQLVRSLGGPKYSLEPGLAWARVHGD